MDNINILFEQTSNFDHKSILNKLNKHIDQSILDKIESGITLEDLEQFKDIPVLKYKTQITIHGLFPELKNNYVFGYKNLFQNKNKSIGIKYNAIDEEKRKRIAKRLNTLNFHYNRNSQVTNFSIMEMVRKDNFEEIRTKLLELKNKIDNTLYFGHISLYSGQIFGVTYLCFDLYINAIYERNIELFLNKLGATIELYNESENKKQIAELEYKNKLELEQKENEAKRNLSIINKQKDIEILQAYPKIDKTNNPGLYILRSFDYNNELIFKVIYLYLPKGKNKVRSNKTEYLTISEALNHKPEQKYSDNIYNSKLTGYLITQPEIKKEVKQITKIENKPISNNLQLINYSIKSIAIIGNTKPIKDDLKAIGGRFNFHLTCGPGWIFPLTKLTEIQNKFNL